MDFRTIKEKLGTGGSIHLTDSNGNGFEFLKLSQWDGDEEGVLLVHELFQLKGLVGNFSEVALDIIEYSPDRVIFHSPPVPWFTQKPISKGFLKFAFIKQPFWNNLLFKLGEVVVFRLIDSMQDGLVVKEVFPFFEGKVKEMKLEADGGVKIIKP